VQARILQPLSDAEQAQLVQLLDRLVAAHENVAPTSDPV